MILDHNIDNLERPGSRENINRYLYLKLIHAYTILIRMEYYDC
jgi:hypothetical protein